MLFRSECSVHLTNKVQTLNNVSGINISLPSGTIKLNLREYATHIKLMYHGLQWVLAVTGRESLGNDLYLINYTVDWLKDYWLKYADKSGYYRIARSSLSTLWSKYTPDAFYPVSIDTEITNTIGNALATSLDNYAIYAIINTYSAENLKQTVCYGMSFESWIVLQSTILKDADTANAVVKAYIAPSVLYATFGRQGVRNIDIPKSETAGHGSIPIPTGDEFTAYPIIPTLQDSVFTNFNTGLTIPFNDWRDDKLTIQSMYIPLLGTLTINPAITHGAVIIRYLFDMVDGTVCGIINDNNGTRTAQNPLPQIAIATSSEPQAVRQLTGNMLANTATSVATTAAMGAGAAGFTGAMGGALAGTVTSLYGYGVAVENARYGAVSFTSASG